MNNRKNQARISEVELAKFRKDTLQLEKLIHFNNAGAALPPRQVTETVVAYLQEEALTGGYRMEAIYLDALQELYRSSAQLLNARPDEIAFVQSATQAWRIAFNGIRFKPGDVILTAESEYGSNYLGLLQASQYDKVEIKVVPNDENGQISLEALKRLVDDRVRLISLTHISSNSGLVQPAEEVGKIAEEAGCLYLLDACQSVGQIPLDVQRIGCHFLALTGRKYLRAPRGTGLLFIRKDMFEEEKAIFLDILGATFKDRDNYAMRSDARRFETYESSRALQLGLNTAIKYALDIGIDRIWKRVEYLAALLRDSLATISNVKVLDEGVVRCGIVTFTVEGMPAPKIKEKLIDQGINISVSGLSSAVLYMERIGSRSHLRASVHYYNSETEIQEFVNRLKKSI